MKRRSIGVVLGSSIIRFVCLAALIVSVALALWLLDVDRLWIVVGVLLAWLVASAVEWLGWQRADARWGEIQIPAAPVPQRQTHAVEPPPAFVPPPPPAAVAETIVVPPPVEPTPSPPALVPPPEPAEPGEARRRPSLLLRRTSEPVAAAAEAEAIPDPEPAPEPEPEPEPAPPEPEQEPEPEPVLQLQPDPEPEPEPVRPVLVAAPPLPPEPPAEPVQPSRPQRVVQLPTRGAREWNLWELERLSHADPDSPQAEERALILLHLRQHADANGTLPVEFDSLVREWFGRLLAGVGPA